MHSMSSSKMSDACLTLPYVVFPPFAVSMQGTVQKVAREIIGRVLTALWRARLQDNYDNDFEMWMAYADMYGLAERLGFQSAEEAWDANPLIQGSVYPEDFRLADPGAIPDKEAVSPRWMSKKKKPGGKKKFRPHAEILKAIVDRACEPVVAAAKKKRPKKTTRGDCVFQSTSPSVTDNKDHYPINSLAQARNALARVMQHDGSPSWYKGSLAGLQKAVKSAVYAKYPGLKKRKEEREKAASAPSDRAKQC